MPALVDDLVRLAQACRRHRGATQRRGYEEEDFDQLWMACGGSSDHSGSISMAHLISFLRPLGVTGGLEEPDVLQSPASPTSPPSEAEVSYVEMVNLVSIDAELLDVVAASNTKSQLEKNISRLKVPSEVASNMRAKLFSLLRFKRMLQRVQKRRHRGRQLSFAVMSESVVVEPLPEAPRFGGTGSRVPSRRSGRLKENKKEVKKDVGGGGHSSAAPANKDTPLPDLAVIMQSSSKRMMRPVNLSALPSLDQSSFDETVASWDRKARRKAAEDRQDYLKRIRKTHPHTLDNDIVKNYASRSVRAPLLERLEKSRTKERDENSPTQHRSSPSPLQQPSPTRMNTKGVPQIVDHSVSRGVQTEPFLWPTKKREQGDH